jgi:hypothetical protein
LSLRCLSAKGRASEYCRLQLLFQLGITSAKEDEINPQNGRLVRGNTGTNVKNPQPAHFTNQKLLKGGRYGLGYEGKGIKIVDVVD